MSSIDDELGIAPGIHGLVRRIRRFLAGRGLRVGATGPLDPLVVDNEAWRTMRRSVRPWPDYKEAPNAYRILVSAQDWEEYWGIDAQRKADNVSRYLLKQAADKDYWIAGAPQVSFEESDELAQGDVRVLPSFAETAERAQPVSRSAVSPSEAYAGSREAVAEVPAEEREPRWDGPADRTAPMMRPQVAPGQDDSLAERLRYAMPDASPDETVILRRVESPAPAGEGGPEAEGPDDTVVLPADVPPVAYLTDGADFRMAVHPGDVIGAVREGQEVPDDVNLRLDGETFPDVEPRHLSLAATAAGWTVTDLAECGTKLRRASGEEVTLRQGDVASIGEGDVVCLGSDHPLTFEQHAV